MATPKKQPTQKEDRAFKNVINNLSNTINDLSASIYGTKNDANVDKIDQEFRSILNSELKEMRGSGSDSLDDMSSFISKLYSKERNDDKLRNLFNSHISSIDGNDTTISSFLTEVYRNKLIYQSDIHDISKQLIELSEAVNTMRDAIVTADIVDGRINREIKFKGIDSQESQGYIPIIEKIEERFGLKEKIKNFIVKEGLIYGEYYVYIIPYSAIFSDFVRNKDKRYVSSMYMQESSGNYDTITKEMEKGNMKYINLGCEDAKEFIESCYDKMEYDKDRYPKYQNEKEFHKNFTQDMEQILSRITVINESVPLPILEEGMSSMEMFSESFVNESGDAFQEAPQIMKDNAFMNYMRRTKTKKSTSESSEGLFHDKKSSKEEDFSEIKDCYVKMLAPTKVVEIKVMDEIIGYFYVKTDNATPLSGVLSSNLYQTKFNKRSNEKDIVTDIASRIVEKFDKKFLKENPKFKKLIVEAINYYDLNETSIKFQFIPKEYMVSFKIDKDEDGNGTSMLDGSMFYAKLYLMLLLFKILSILLYSNDTRVNYIRQSGINKDLTNKVQQIAIQKQARTINIMDLFNYTTMLNKIGNGNELYIPTGRSNERPMETDVIGGQDIQINNELMELLRNSYILGTGVPAAIMNYLNEADFAKSIEVANTKFNGRVVNYQLDFNPGLTEMYRKILSFSTNIEEADVNSLEVSLIKPKNGQNTIKSEALSNFTAIRDFLVTMYFGETNTESSDEFSIREFTKELAKLYLPILNFDEIENALKKAQLAGKGEEIKPKEEPSNDDLLNGM